jgi:hypothetical protein
MNFTITVPEGTTNHGNPNLLCTPAQWYDFIVFFFANYFAHAASVVLEPGQSLRRTGVFILFALTLPGSGVVRALFAILRHAATETKNPLKRAARAGALCMVLKKPTTGRFALRLRLQRPKLSREYFEDMMENMMGISQTAEKGMQIEVEQSDKKVNSQGSDDILEVSATQNTHEERKESPPEPLAPESRTNDKESVFITLLDRNALCLLLPN